MAITTYSELKAAVADWLHRTDLTAMVPDFITLAESVLSADIRSRHMETRTTIACTASNAFVAIPSDIVEMRRIVVTDASPRRVLKYVTPDELTTDYSFDRVGVPAVFAVIGEEIELAPIPDSAYTLEVVYAQRIPALSDINPTNWLLTQYPNAYLYGALLQAQPYIVNDARIPAIQQMYGQIVQSINTVDYYTGTTMRVRAS